MLDLYNKQYDIETLKVHLYAVSLRDILKSQRLTCDFCVKYILNTNYQMNPNDQGITVADVVKYQPHITKGELYRGIINYSPDDDSYEDFESVSLKN
jgi:hypothetical protein